MSNNGSGENAEPFSTNDSKSESFISLHPIERKILSILYDSKDNWVADDELIKKSELYIDQIRRGIEWLRFKNFITIEDTTEIKFSLKSNLLKNNSFLLPERKLVNCV
ncbi:MAG TPA: hypothetical protein VFX18_03545, partial [Candidatus Nitrosocosmicus sp.]|nr:hypothetical protein [Candidatus Nitrosocosmicus sp.]